MVGRTRGKAGRGYVDSPWMRQQLRSGQRILPTGRGTRAERQSPRLNLGSNGDTGLVRHRSQPVTAESTVQKGTVRKRTNQFFEGQQDREEKGNHTTKARSSDSLNISRETNDAETDDPLTFTNTTRTVSDTKKLESYVTPNKSHEESHTPSEILQAQTNGTQIDNTTNETSKGTSGRIEVNTIQERQSTSPNVRTNDGSNTPRKSDQVHTDSNFKSQATKAPSTETSVRLEANAIKGWTNERPNTSSERKQVQTEVKHTTGNTNDPLETSEWIDENALMEEIDSLLEPEEALNSSHVGTMLRNSSNNQVNGRKIKKEQLDNNSATTKLHAGIEVAMDLSTKGNPNEVQIQIQRKREVMGSTYISRTARSKAIAPDPTLLNTQKKKKTRSYFMDVQEFASQVALPEGEIEWDSSPVPGSNDSNTKGGNGTSTDPPLASATFAVSNSQAVEPTPWRKSADEIRENTDVNEVSLEDAHMESTIDDDEIPPSDINEAGSHQAKQTQLGNHRTVESKTFPMDHTGSIQQSIQSVRPVSKTKVGAGTNHIPLARDN